MESLFIDAVQQEIQSPKVSFNVETHIFELSGESYLENTDEFYTKITDWLREYISSYEKPLVFNVKLNYFNSSSAKSILTLLKELKNHKKVRINWYYPTDNPDLLLEGEDFMEALGISFNFIPFEIEY